MLNIDFNKNDPDGEGIHILCIGAHCDDIEIGCGGTILKMIAKGKVAFIHWVVFSSTPERKKEAEISAAQFLVDTEHTIIIHSFKDGYMPAHWSEIKDEFELLKREVNPDLIFTHTRDDRHQDHRMIHNLTWNTFRNHMILEYEIPKYDGDLGRPNVFVPIGKELLKKKISILTECFGSQLDKHWFDEILLMSLPRIRSVECASETNYAEAFYGRKLIYSPF